MDCKVSYEAYGSKSSSVVGKTEFSDLSHARGGTSESGGIVRADHERSHGESVAGIDGMGEFEAFLCVLQASQFVPCCDCGVVVCGCESDGIRLGGLSGVYRDGDRDAGLVGEISELTRQVFDEQ